MANILHKRMGFNVTFGGGQHVGIGLASKMRSREEVTANGGNPWKNRGSVSILQLEQYLSTSASAEECTLRIHDHIILGKRSDLDLRTQAMLEEQARTIRGEFAGELAELRAMLRKPTPTVTETVSVDSENDLVTHVAPTPAEELPALPTEGELLDVGVVAKAAQPMREPPRPKVIKERKPFQYTDEQIEKMAAEVGMKPLSTPNKGWKYMVRTKWEKAQARKAAGV